MTRGKRGKPAKSAKKSCHTSHDDRDGRGDSRRATTHQREKITEWLGAIMLHMTPRKLEQYTSRSDSFWYAGKTGRWGNCVPTVQDYLDIRRVAGIVEYMSGQVVEVAQGALDIARAQAVLTRAVDRELDIVKRVIQARE